MNVDWTIRLAPLLGRERAYRRVVARLNALRVDPVAHTQACRRAASRWSLNWESGSRSSAIRDYRFLLDVLAELRHSAVAEHARIDAAVAIVTELEARLLDDARYRVDGRMLKSWDDARERVALANQLKHLLGGLGATPEV